MNDVEIVPRDNGKLRQFLVSAVGTNEMKDPKHITSNNGKSRQFLAAIVVNLISVSSGITWGWPSPTIPQLHSNHPPIGNSPMTEDETSWIGGLMAIGGLLIIPFCGFLSERLGRKKFALVTGIPHIISWLLIIFAGNPMHLYAARLTGGMGAAMTVFITPLYSSEISTEDIRGILGSLLLFSVNVGTLFAYVTGAYLSYRLFASLSLLFSVSFIVIFSFMPETPVYLVRRNRMIEARKALMFLRGNNEVLVEQELTKLQSQTNQSNNSTKSVGLCDLFKDRATRKGLIISFMLLGSQQLSGIFAMVSYVETIFKRAGSSISSEIASIIIGSIQIIGSYISTMLMDRAGRRLLTLISCFGMAISHSVVAYFFYLQLNKHDVSSIAWLPLVALSTYVITYCLGIGPVPYVVTAEVFRQDVSSSATTVCYIFYWAISFASIQGFTLAMKFLGVDGCFFMLASFCTISFVLCYCLLPETKGRDRQDIVDELAGKRGDEISNVDKRGESESLVTKPV